MKINQKSAATLAVVCGLSLMALTSEQALAVELVCSVDLLGGFVGVGSSAATEPGRDRQRPEAVAAEETQFGFEHHRHDQDEDKSHERNDEADGKTTDGESEAKHQSEADQG